MASSQGAPPSPTQSRSKKGLFVTEQPKLDLESYIANYTGRTRLERMILIGNCSAVLGIDAFKLAVREAKLGKDITKYLEAQTPLETIAPKEKEAARDLSWMDKTKSTNAAETARLESEVKGYKNNLIKESTRMGNEDLGKHFQAIGDLPKAFEAFSRMRQDAQTPKHIIDISRHLIEVAVEQRNWIAVTSNVQKIRGVMDSKDSDKAIPPFLCVAEGLSSLDSGEYLAAALSFLQTDSGMSSSANSIISPNDVAVYGGICALATMERAELTKNVLENSNFRTYLELEPHIRRAIGFFVNSRYAQCLSILESYRSDYLLDIHLQRHVDDLYQLIRSKSIVQYFIPFSCVTLDSLNEQFAAPGKTIEKELVQMIMRKELDARIDTVNRVLTSVPSAPRAALQSSVLKTAKDYEREAMRRIQHMNILAADVDIKSRNKLPGGDDFFDGGRELRSGRNTGY
ncbi:COP9 signalosome-like protein complex subunit 1 [Mollisia scopiformis]|uniref:COP9 signalosome complex subunit 1 n=1 Tax=Mollisia scopiformis TaxID=149040 RepID=A0A194XLU6_MOLSC|nr:COP9 signalosome-like protein complex subunit 1 [Mollisia scopiformis]KUJ21153.1 COP9 signalosome-like protein complex subunit 1 [Mollisia scopiformis]